MTDKYTSNSVEALDCTSLRWGQKPAHMKATQKKVCPLYMRTQKSEGSWHEQQSVGWQTAFEMWWHTRRKPDFLSRRNGRVHLNRLGRQFSRLLAVEVCASAVVMVDTPCSEVVWRVLATHSIRQFPLHFPSCASRCVITFQLDS